MMAKKNQIVKQPQDFVLDHDEYSKVSCAARLQEIKLIASSYYVLPDAFELSSRIDSMKNKFSGNCTDFIYDKDEGMAWGRFQWAAEIKSGRRVCLRLVSEYLVLYSDMFECDADHVEAYFLKVGRFATYPYFRSTFSHNVGETGLALPPLPSLRERGD